MRSRTRSDLKWLINEAAALAGELDPSVIGADDGWKKAYGRRSGQWLHKYLTAINEESL